MKIYFLSSQIPELKSVPPDLRSEIVDEALDCIPFSWKGLGSFAVIFLPIALVCVVIQVKYEKWGFLLYCLTFSPLLWIWWLNMAVPGIREGVQKRSEQEKLSKPESDPRA